MLRSGGRRLGEVASLCATSPRRVRRLDGRVSRKSGGPIVPMSMLPYVLACAICTGKKGKMDKRSHCQEKYRLFGNFAQTQGKNRILEKYREGTRNFLILEIFAVFAPKFHLFSLSRAECVCQVSVTCETSSNQGNCGWTGKKLGKQKEFDRENRKNMENGPTKFPVRENKENLGILSKHREFVKIQGKHRGFFSCSSGKCSDSKSKRHCNICRNLKKKNSEAG